MLLSSLVHLAHRISSSRDSAAPATQRYPPTLLVLVILAAHLGDLSSHLLLGHRPAPPLLLVPVDAMSNPGRFGIRHAGAFELRWLNWVMTLGNPNLHGLKAKAILRRGGP